jgi:hypothetical protein
VPGSSVSIATGYGLDGPGSNPGEGEIFRTCPDRPWGPSNFLYNGYRVFSGGKERPGRDADHSSPSSAVGHERVELYLYSLYRLYGLYRASVPVQGVHFTFIYFSDYINKIHLQCNSNYIRFAPPPVSEFSQIWCFKSDDEWNIYERHFILSGNRRGTLYCRKVSRMDRRSSFKDGFRNFLFTD